MAFDIQTHIISPNQCSDNNLVRLSGDEVGSYQVKI